MNRRLFLGLFIFSSVLLFAQLSESIGSSSYNTTAAVTAGGGNGTSTNYLSVVYVLDSAGNTTSANYETTVGQFFSSEDTTPPIITFEEPPTPENGSTVYLPTQTIVASISDASNTSAWMDFDNDLLGYWAMDYYNSTGIFDNSSYGHFATFGGGSSTSDITTGKRGNAMEFEDAGYLVAGSSNDMNVWENFTLSAWINVKDSDPYNGIFTRWGNIFMDVTDGTDFNMGSAVDPYPQVSATGVITTNTWYHVAATHNSTDYISIYIDGEFEVGGTVDIPPDTTSNVHIGSWDTEYDIFNGTIDEVMLFNRTLSGTEIKALYNSKVNKFNATFDDLEECQHNYTVYAIDQEGYASNSGERNFVYSSEDALDIISPNTSNPLSVSANDNVSIYFDYFSGGETIISGVSLEKVLFGGIEAEVVTSGANPDNTGKSCGNACSGGYYTYYNSAQCTDNILADSCEGTGEPVCGGDDTVVDIWLNGTSFLSTDTINVTMQVNCYSTAEDEVKIWYYNGSSWNEEFYDANCDYDGATGNYSINVEITSSSPTQYIRGQVTWYTLSGDDECYTGGYGDNDDINFSVVSSGEEFAYAAGEGWQANVTAPGGLSKYQDLFVNATYGGNTRNDTETDAINYGNTAPGQVTLAAPEDGNTTTNRSPQFSWEEASDFDGDPLTYYLNFTCGYTGGGSDCSDDNREYTVGNGNCSGDGFCNYTIPKDLKYFGDDNYYYNWSVRAYDNEDYGAWSSVRNITINTEVSINLYNNSITFGSITIFDTNDTTDDDPEPFRIRNDGNCFLDVNISSTDLLWDTQPSASDYYRYKIDNVTGEENSLNWSSANTTSSWAPVPAVNGSAISYFNYSDSTDEAEIDIEISVPVGEIFGSKASTVWFTAGYRSEYE